jgi:hypothetical protein
VLSNISKKEKSISAPALASEAAVGEEAQMEVGGQPVLTKTACAHHDRVPVIKQNCKL